MEAVQSLAWISDRDTGRFRGFAFIEMEDSAANAAMKALNGQMVDGREMRVNEARPQNDRATAVAVAAAAAGRGGYEQRLVSTQPALTVITIEIDGRSPRGNGRFFVPTIFPEAAFPGHSAQWNTARSNRLASFRESKRIMERELYCSRYTYSRR